MTDVIDDLHRRGLIAQSTDEAALRAHLAEGRSRTTPGSTRRRRACTSATCSSSWCCVRSSAPGTSPSSSSEGPPG
ncbi:hypothetical protein [Blastococcus brunescens]|uniref:Uncharacterized protein n=1 Tax=Blastococcus brunescens TaxID=1564165 RepID=A0ABZ1B9E1_9ACTN|nr:hypothetical protein [Blastococcus sp. BMG 8361]WRL66316.1 hypothetical protein U6N30_13215 [Blastococcus sp. BMG 8361]